MARETRRRPQIIRKAFGCGRRRPVVREYLSANLWYGHWAMVLANMWGEA